MLAVRGKASYPPEMAPILMMKLMGWSWRDYRTAPEWLIDLIELWQSEIAKAEKDAEFQRKAQRRGN